MLSKEASVKVKVNASFKRFLCLLLVLLMFPLDALAVVVPGGGTNIGYAGGKTTKFRFREYVGIALGIQQMKGDEYKIGKPTEDEVKSGKKGTLGLANVTRHFLYSYPNPYSPSGGQGLFYIVPKAAGAPKYVAAVSSAGVGQAPIGSNWCYASSGAFSHTKSDELFKALTSKISDQNPNPSIDPNYFNGLVAKYDKAEAEKLINYIFGRRKSNTEVDVAAINQAFDIAYRYGTDDLAKAPVLQDTRKVANYAAIILSLARLMPKENWGTYEGYVRDFVCTFTKGEAFTPVVITAELCMPFEHNGNGSFNTWRTVAEEAAILTGVEEPKIRTADVSMPSVINAVNGSNKNPAFSIIKIAQAEGARVNGSMLGGMCMLGINSKGDENTQYGAYCRHLSSVSSGSIANATTWLGNLPKEGIWGCGIFGIDDALTPPVLIPPTSVELAPVGTVSILVEDKKYQKSVGGYSETFTVTLDVNLGASYRVDSTDTSKTANGVGLANTLYWLYQMKQKGYNIPNPEIAIYLAQAEAIPALSGDAANNLISQTMGYYGDGNEYVPNLNKVKVSSNNIEAGMGNPFKWNLLNLSLGGNLVFKDGGIKGVKATTRNGALIIEITDLLEAYEYFQKHSGNLVFVGEFPGSGTLETESSKNQHWFKVGMGVSMSGPKSLEDMNSVTTIKVGLQCIPKYDYSTVVATPEDKPYYYSKYQRPYSELKQGTVPATGGGSSEKFNSMTGTPTFTDTSTRVDFKGTGYENSGRYYQYFASGGSEFVVQFDGEYVASANASRTYTATFSPVPCHMNNGSHHYVPSKDGPIHVEDKAHCPCNYHDVSDTFTWTQSVNGFSYVKITNLKVWKLSEAKLDGTRELLDTDEVTATVKTVAPSVSYNIAGANNAAEGRLIYSWETKQKDTAKIPGYPKPSDNNHDTHRQTNQKTLDGDTAGITCGATCVSDFIVLRTSNGDQSILYYEYKSKNEAAINKGNCVADPIEFDPVPYEVIWKSNSKTSEGCSLPEDGITYGGYNGNYASMSTKYKSSGHASNIDFNSTEVYKNKGVMSGSWDAVTEKPTQKFRLMNDTLVIPDSKQNGEYIVGRSKVFYENIINFGTEQPNYPITQQSDFGGRKGFVVETTYSPTHDKINDIVVYNPVSNQNAIVVSLPKDRDQRIATHATTPVDKSTTCPGDASCPFLKNECSVTEHIHTESCYDKISYEVHGPNNAHTHTQDCKRHTIGTHGTWTSNSHYSSHSVTGYKTTLDGYEVVAGDDGFTYMFGSECQRGSTIQQYGTSFPLANKYTYTTDYNGQSGHRDIQWKFKSPLNTGEAGVVYECNNLPLNSHKCDAGSEGAVQKDQTINKSVSYAAAGTDAYSFTAVSSGTVRFYSTSYNKDPRGRIFINNVLKVDNDDGGKNLNFDTGTVSFAAGDVIRLNVYQYGSTGSGTCETTIVIHYDSLPPVSTVKCYTVNKSVLSCSDPHHAYSYNWKIYTYGLKHESGAICSGRGCTDTSDLIFPTQKKYTQAQCAAGYIVKHANGEVHLSTTQGTCSYCGATYKEVLSKAESTDRTPAESEYSCYAYGDPRCWKPCGNDDNHKKHTTEIVDNGTTYKMGDFINLDWPFTIYFPNTGDFYGTGAKWSSTTSPERGYGYVNGMDTTEWIKAKWVEFPFAVIYNDQTYLANERIYLSVPKTKFEFYVPLHNNEVANAEVKFGTVAINTQNGNELECGPNSNRNIENITYAGKPMAHHHNSDKRTYIDVVGRIGNLTLNDTGDFRFSNLFKQPLTEWLVKNIVRKVDPTKQNNIMLDMVDVRKVPVASTGVAGNTHNTRPERGNINKILPFPLTPAKNNITALQRQPIRVGYDSYFDLTTLGNYYGNALYDESGKLVKQNLVLVKPHYYRLDLTTGDYKPVDVYMDVNGNKVLINDNDSNTVAYNGKDANVNLNWVEEKDRRNYSGSEVTNSQAVASANDWVELPRGSSWVYGNYNILNLTQRNRTFVGSEYTYNDKTNWNSHKDPSDSLPNTLAALQGQRWHFNVGLPSSAVFVYSGQQPSQANIDACTSGNAVIFCALEIYSQGEVWTLAYDGSNVNAPFKVTPDGKTYDPVVPYPSNKSPRGEEMPIVSIISINHSSKEDLDVAGTQ